MHGPCKNRGAGRTGAPNSIKGCLHDPGLPVCIKTILLYMQTGLARLGGISLDSNGALGQPGLNLSM